jgi:hypothetical protein
MTVTTVEEAMIEKLRLLPPDMQQAALDFIEFLSWKREGKRPYKSSLGLCSDLNISISKEEIDEARREMWANFPRERFFETEEKQ